MLRVLFLSTILIAASMHAFAQVQERPMEKGKTEDLRGVTKLYVEAGFGEFWLVQMIVKSIRKEIPELAFVTFADDADAWLLISQEHDTQSEPASNASPDYVPRRRFKFSSKVQARIISLHVPGQPRLVKKISTNWQEIFGGGGEHPTPSLAREFVTLYKKANSTRQIETTRLVPAATAPPRLIGGPTPAGAETQTSVSPTNSGAEEIGDDDVVRVNTSLVTIHANVIGRDGRPAPSLRQDDFTVYEDGVKQDLAVFEPVDRPFTIVLLIDVSGSVRTRLNAISGAANALVNSLRADDQIVGLTFGSEIKEVLKLTKVRDLPDSGMIISPGGGTRLYDAVDLIIAKYLRRLPGRKAVVMLTDGIDGVLSNGPDGGSFIADAARNLRDAEELDALFYAVQYNTWIEPINTVPRGMKAEDLRKFWEERSTEYLQGLAYKTGGRLYRADGISDLTPAFASVVEELSRQYSLGYYPNRGPRDGERRLIKVRANSPDLVVRARDSYISKSPGVKPAGPK